MADESNKKIDSFIETVGELRKEHPTLEERLDRYRDRRDAYEAKRMSSRTAPAFAPARQRARRGDRQFGG